MKRHRSHKIMDRGRVVALCLLPYSSAILLGCAEERSFDPTPMAVRLYVGGIDYSQPGPARSVLFVFTYDSLAVVDSVPLHAPSIDAVAGADNRSLFIATTNGLGTRSVWNYDMIEKTPAWHLDLDRWVETTDGLGRLRPLNHVKWLLINRYLLSAETGELLKTLADHLVPFGGPPAGTRVAVGLISHGELGPRVVAGYDFAGDTSWGHYLPHLSSGTALDLVYAAELHPDLRRVLVIGIYRNLQNAWFVIGDLTTGETLLEHEMVYPFGEIAISPDARSAAVSDPSRTGIYDSYATLDIYDLDGPRHVRRLTRSSIDPDITARPSQIAWVPDSDAIVVAPSGDLANGGALGVINVGQGIEIGTFFLPGRSDLFEYVIGGMTLGYTVAP